MFKKHYDLRAGLQSYLYSAFETQSRTGLPLARPLVLDSPDDRATWTIDDQYMIGDALMFPPAGMHSPTDTNRKVYFPRTAKSWHAWFHNATSYMPGESVQIDTPIMTAPLFVKGGVPVLYKQQPAEEDGILELHVWMPREPATDCAAVNEEHEQLAWSGVYDDDGETTRYKTHGEHWRGRAGFGASRCVRSSQTVGRDANGGAGRLTLHFETISSKHPSGAAVPHERVQWVVRELSDTVAGIDCVVPGSDAEAGEGEVQAAWSHAVEYQELRVTAPLGHHCTVRLLAAEQN